MSHFIEQLETLLHDRLIFTAVCVFIIIVLLLPFLFIRKHRNNKWLVSSLYVLIIVAAFRFFAICCGDTPSKDLTAYERILDALIHALQTFSMDEDYTTYSTAGKDALAGLGYTELAGIYGFFVYALNIIAPILGGALLLDILTGTVPLLRVRFHPFRHKFVFSRLNEEALSLAEDIMKDKGYKKLLDIKLIGFKPMIIFTDSYSDDESSSQAELLARAKKLNAVCIKSDLLDISLRASRTVTYLLIDNKSENNVSMFSKLLDHEGTRKRSIFPISSFDSSVRTRIYAFVQEEHEADTIHHIYNNGKYRDLISVRAVRDYMNAAINLMSNVPLFLPMLYSPTEKKELNVTILGSGSVAREVLKAMYWCGQMQDVKLNVKIMSNNASQVETHMNEFYSEMMECCRAGSDKLLIYETGSDKTTNPPYFNSIVFEDVDDLTIVSSYEDVLGNTDYYVVALGEDALNYKVTNLISRRLSLLRLKEKSGHADVSCPKNAVIVPAIFDTRLAASIQESTVDLIDDHAVFGTVIIPFATFDGRFSCQNVFFNSFIDDALSTKELYGKEQSGKCADDEYSWNASIVREVHAPYKLFGIGKLDRVRGVGCDLSEISYTYGSDIEVSEQQYHDMGWLEHRRWCAFLRSQGFSRPDWNMFDNYCVPENSNHRSIALKLHPCLIESSRAVTPPIDLSANPSLYKAPPYDRLDYVSVMIYRKKHSFDVLLNVPENERFTLSNRSGYKAYDHYGYYREAEVKNDKGETVLEKRWECNDARLCMILKPQPDISETHRFP